jgi:hypothetical protein
MSTQRVSGNDIIAGVIASTINNNSINKNDAIDLTSASSYMSMAGNTTMSSISDPDFQVLEVSTISSLSSWDDLERYSS